MTALETSRLILRPYVESDFDAMAALHGTPRVMAGLREGALGRDEARGYFDSYRNDWRNLGIGIWALYARADGAYLGECGFWVREGFPGHALRYILDVPHWGQGYALEAARAALAWGFGTMDIPVVNAVSRMSNPASERILQRLGMTLEDPAHKGMNGLHRYAVERTQWLRRRPEWRPGE